jgi:hypothetical protein
MANLELPFGIKVLNPTSLDAKYLNDGVPYVSISGANAAIVSGIRHIGLTVNIANDEYWYRDGIGDGQLVEKITASGGTGLAGIQNIGTGAGEVYSGLSGTTAELRRITGSGDTVVSTVGADIIIFSQATGNTQPIYTGATPSNIDAGGMTSGTTLTGKTLSEIIEDIATTLYEPTLVAPFNTFSDDQTATKEVGITLGTINFYATFNRGMITPPYGTSGFRSGSGNTYNYTGTDLPASVASTLATDDRTINNYVILSGANTWTGSVSYDIGEQPFKSDGTTPYDSPLPADTTGAVANTITGLYPWFYGKVAGGVRPTANQALINSFDTKLVAASTGSIAANYNAVGEWIWFAIPQASTSKIKWEGSNSPSNNGAIGGAVSGGGNLFPDPDVVSINSPSAYWTSISYKIYISNFQTSTYDSGTPYTLTFKNS